MKKVFLLLAAGALLASCILVNDFGSYWDKGTVDNALLGSWKDASDPHNVPIIFISKDAMYQVDGVDHKDNKPVFARTLKAGPYSFFMSPDDVQHPQKGKMLRYVLNGDTLQLYALDDVALSKWLKEKHPGEQNFAVINDAMPVRIGTLNDATFHLLSELPENTGLWSSTGSYARVK